MLLHLHTWKEIKSDKSANLTAFVKPQICLILLYGGSPLSLPLWISYDNKSKPEYPSKFGILNTTFVI